MPRELSALQNYFQEIYVIEALPNVEANELKQNCLSK